jgi:transposase
VNPPPPAYTDREREFSDLRNRMNQLVKDREKLIEEMKQKNFDTGNLFLE